MSEHSGCGARAADSAWGVLVSTADAVDREVAFLSLSGDGLPTLAATGGGPWNVIQSYWPRTPGTRQTGIYLVRPMLRDTRFAAQRRIDTYHYRAKLWWPIGATAAGTGLWETEQRAFDAAVDLLITRVRGFVGDHSHASPAGSFLSVAEAPEPGEITVIFADPEVTASAVNALRADLSYLADDRDSVV